MHHELQRGIQFRGIDTSIEIVCGPLPKVLRMAGEQTAVKESGSVMQELGMRSIRVSQHWMAPKQLSKGLLPKRQA